MNPSRFLWVVAAAACLLCPMAVRALPAPFALEQPSSADLTITTRNGLVIQAKIHLDGDKVRSEMAMNGMDMVTIVRRDTGKIYEVLEAQKTTMEMDYDPKRFKEYSEAVASFRPEGKFELIGPATINGVLCTEYRVTGTDPKKAFDFWLDMARKVPVKMAAEDGSFTVEWRNYQSGPQDAALFEPPAGFQVMPLMGMGTASPESQ